jgi:hypothetical protein
MEIQITLKVKSTVEHRAMPKKSIHANFLLIMALVLTIRFFGILIKSIKNVHVFIMEAVMEIKIDTSQESHVN